MHAKVQFGDFWTFKSLKLIHEANLTTLQVCNIESSQKNRAFSLMRHNSFFDSIQKLHISR